MGVVSIITGITIFVSGQHAQAAEMTQSSSDSKEQSQQTEQVEQKEDTTHLSYELNQEGETASQSKTSQENQSDGNVQKKGNQTQQDSTQTSPLNDQEQTLKGQQSKDNQRQYGGTVSDLFKGGQDNMVSTITTLGTPHNGTPAADKLGSTKFIKDTINRIGKIGGTKALDLELGFSQWGFKQQPNESYAEYAKRIANSKVWETEDQAVNDLTTAGAEKLNQMTTLNPNIVYTSYTGAATHTGPLGNEVPNIRQFPLFDLTSRVIGGDDNKNVRVNDGIVPVSSSLHPSDEAFKKVGMMNLATDKGIWQVRPVQYDWDHLDLVGLDTTDYKRTGEELGQFYMSMINNMLKVEELDGITRK